MRIVLFQEVNECHSRVNVNAHYSPPLSIGRARQNVSHFSSHFSTAFYLYISQDSQSPFLVRGVAWLCELYHREINYTCDDNQYHKRPLCHKKKSRGTTMSVFVLYTFSVVTYCRPNPGRLHVCHATKKISRENLKITPHKNPMKVLNTERCHYYEF